MKAHFLYLHKFYKKDKRKKTTHVVHNCTSPSFKQMIQIQ
jgi:hypothetical protein